MNGRKLAPINDPVLKSSPLFQYLSDLELNAVAAFLEPRRIKCGEVIFNEGAEGKEMFVLISGMISASVKRIDGTSRVMFEIRPGDFFGEMSVIANESRSATLNAKVDSMLLVLHGIDFYRIIFDHPIIGAKMLKAIRQVQNVWLEQTSSSLSDLMRWGETARRRAVSDDLTGLYNRRFLEESVHGRFTHGSVGLRSLSLLMMDLDKIHIINETYGSKAGDLVFIEVAKMLRNASRNEDICARLAGDEFAVLLPDTEPEEACEMAERIRQTIANCKVSVPKAPDSPEQTKISIHTSIGIAAAPIHADSWERLMLTADTALRRSKELGRNRIEVYKPELSK